MDDLSRTAVREAIEILKDKQWHDVYELHEKYHMSALQVFQAINTLMGYGLVEKVGFNIRLITKLENKHVALLNALQKTRRPSKLDFYQPRHLTKGKR